jgi:hypothetical protein
MGAWGSNFDFIREDVIGAFGAFMIALVAGLAVWPRSPVAVGAIPRPHNIPSMLSAVNGILSLYAGRIATSYSIVFVWDLVFNLQVLASSQGNGISVSDMVILIAVKSLIPLPTVLALLRQGMDGGAREGAAIWHLVAITAGTGGIALMYSLIFMVVRGSALDLPVYAILLNDLVALSAFVSVAFFLGRTKLVPDNAPPDGLR